MPKRYFLFLIALCIFSFTAFSQNEETLEVYDFDSEPEILKTRATVLDKTHPNLLNPQISKDEYQSVIESWTKLHNDLAIFLNENDFKWDTDATEVMIFHKFYFDPNGTIHTYGFNMLNEDIDESQRQQYSDLIHEFGKTYNIGLIKDGHFAQCGKTKMLNEKS